MQKLDLGVDYESDSETTPGTTEPVTAEPVATSTKTAATSETSPAPTSKSTVTTHTPTAQAMKKKTAPFSILIAVIAIVAGSATGVGAFKLQSKSDPLVGGAPIQQVAGDNVNNGDVFGSTEEANFKDSAEGYLKIGGFEGEGSHHILRAGGPDQTVYLVSSVTDLDKFDGMEVKVWGETFEGQKAGWLMDVGRIQIVNTQGQAPSEE